MTKARIFRDRPIILLDKKFFFQSNIMVRSIAAARPIPFVAERPEKRITLFKKIRIRLRIYFPLVERRLGIQGREELPSVSTRRAPMAAVNSWNSRFRGEDPRTATRRSDPNCNWKWPYKNSSIRREVAWTNRGPDPPSDWTRKNWGGKPGDFNGIPY